MPLIMPIKDLRNTTEISNIAHKEQEPIFITRACFREGTQWIGAWTWQPKRICEAYQKRELQSRIDRKNEEIDLLKVGLSGIVKRYGYQNVQEFYQIYRKSYNAYITCKKQVAKWEKTYGEDNQKQNKESVLERLRNPPKKTADYQHFDDEHPKIWYDRFITDYLQDLKWG